MSSLDATATSISRTFDPDLIPGYRLEKLVGAGGMGEVHKATQLSLGRTVAVKLLSQQLAQDESFVARFQKEAAALATLHHPHIVSIVDKGSTPTTYYLVMEFVDGPSLRERMRQAPEDPFEHLRIMMQICRAIEYAHNRGVIHRDLKPENILFDMQAGDLPKVTDFGLASFLEDSSTRFALTSTHVAMGTLSYMAPEQRVDAKNADGRADIFALGLIFYELLVGELPAGHYDPPSRRKPGVDPKLDGIIDRCLKQQPEERYPNVTALIRDIEPLIPHYTTIAPAKLSRVQRAKRVAARVVRTCLQVVATVMVIASVGILGVAWMRSGEKRVERTPGAALTADLGLPAASSLAGRLMTVEGETRRVTLGEGPDKPSVLVSGRPLELEDRTIVFPSVMGQSRVGLMRVDVRSMRGSRARFSARVDAREPEPTLANRLRSFKHGEAPDPEVALLLLGSTGRYVALVYSGAGAPLRLEWSLGEKRGIMLGEDSPDGPVQLSLEVDDEGVLVASVGTKEDQRPMGEPLHLGTDWQSRRFGDEPVPALGCIEGRCQAENFTYQVWPAPKQSTTAQLTPPPPASRPAAAPARRAPTKSTSSKGKRSK
ncbi:serine/threonine protein kinase [Cystobacter fuscus]|uniref:Serine/threonine protein kinase n=1 Tax=Cystobacter fuscus TaxID=43 RepID=A0A250IYF4_9BACT|nr:serine/threonine-protein kinase [Cystobacter fuscus]ATB36191.1 serine/threonine protein kinase [Cystobacter fuscus]